jgi:hypothetical protein
MILAIGLKLLFAGLSFLVGIAAEWAAGVCLMESSKPEVKGGEVVLYGCGWTVGLIGGAILLITGLFLAVHAFF